MQIKITRNQYGYYDAVARSYRANYYAEGFCRWVDAWDALMKLIKSKNGG
jgi:hypothetical protein